MILVVGLGNPGEKHENTRHNIGFMVLDKLLKKLTPVNQSNWEENSKFNCLVSKAGDDLILVKPLSFMNASGEVVQKITSFYKISNFALYVIHDDLDLAFGKIKITFGHGSAGHKGVESIIQHLGSNNFVRIRVGIGSDKKVDGENFVLSDFAPNETGKLGRIIKKTTEAVQYILDKGVEKAANKYN